jgi:hypothetical protein
VLARQLHLFTGKGGVGKSTVVAAAAVAAARRDRRPLIVELGHASSMASIFGVPRVGPTPTDVGHGVHAIAIDVETALLGYVTDVVRVRAIARAALRSQSLRRFLFAAPAVAEIAALHTIRKIADTTPRWDPILIDLDATGHAKMFLELPRVFEGLVRGGPLESILASFASLFRDPDRAVLHLVALPSELPIEETVELHRAFAPGDRVSLGLLVVNRAPEAPLAAEHVALLDAEAHGHEDVALARASLRAWESTRALIDTLRREVPLPVVEIPDFDERPSSVDVLAAIGERFDDAARRQP